MRSKPPLPLIIDPHCPSTPPGSTLQASVSNPEPASPWSTLFPLPSREQPIITSPFDNPLTALDPFPSVVTGPGPGPGPGSWSGSAGPSRPSRDGGRSEKGLSISFAGRELDDFAATLENPIPDRKVADLGQLDAAMEFMVGQQRTDISDEEYRRVRNKVSGGRRLASLRSRQVASHSFEEGRRQVKRGDEASRC